MKTFNNKTAKSPRITRKLIIGVALFTLFSGLGVGAMLLRRDSSPPPEKNTTDTSASNYINLDPPTDEDKLAADRNKQEIMEQQEQQGQSDEKSKVVPVISFSGQRGDNVEVRSYVAEVYESTGTCTATFSKGDAKITKSVEGIKDATYTRCDRFVIANDEFPTGGAWSVVVSYLSPTAKGVSQAIILELE